MPFAENKLDTLQAIDRAFDFGTKQNHKLNTWLLVANLLLVGILVFDALEYYHYIYLNESFHALIRNVELLFGIIFLIEFTLRAVFVYIPDKKFFSTYSIINMLVIISLLAPQFIGNLAVLRFIRILKVYKAYRLNKDHRSYHIEQRKKKKNKKNAA